MVGGPENHGKSSSGRPVVPPPGPELSLVITKLTIPDPTPSAGEEWRLGPRRATRQISGIVRNVVNTAVMIA